LAQFQKNVANVTWNANLSLYSITYAAAGSIPCIPVVTALSSSKFIATIPTATATWFDVQLIDPATGDPARGHFNFIVACS
jgi:hypothetical protein